jgi:hypothetical protein
MNYDDQQLPKPKAIGDYLRPDRIPLLQPETQRRRPRSERAELIGYFTDRINDARQGTKFRLLRYAAVATKLKGWSVFNLYRLKRECEEYERSGGAFSKGFFGIIKRP